MFKSLFLSLSFFFLPLTQGHSLPIQPVSFEELEEKTEEELEMSQESLFNEEEEISALPKKGNRPQVVQIPSKNSSPQ